jgi:integration host factor subunit beta
MTKAELTEEVSRVVEMTRKESGDRRGYFDSVVRALCAGDKVEIRGLGSFRTGHGRRAWGGIRKQAHA